MAESEETLNMVMEAKLRSIWLEIERLPQSIFELTVISCKYTVVNALMLILLLAIASPARAQDASKDPLEPSMAKELLVSLKNIWPRFNIDVCWRDAGVANSQNALLVNTAVHDQIETNSPYRFQGWIKCGPFTRSRIEISIISGQPHTDGVGYQQDGLPGDQHDVPTRMYLNFTFTSWGANSECSADIRTCIKTIAVHEFLHGLGALHEQVQPSTASSDPKCYSLYQNEIQEAQRDYTLIPLTTYDPDSIMNYCHDIYQGATRLSEKDKQGLITLAGMTKKKMRETSHG